MSGPYGQGQGWDDSGYGPPPPVPYHGPPYGYPQPIYVPVAPPSNGLGTAGFVLALLGLVLVPVYGIGVIVFWPVLLLMWGLGLLFSFIGIFSAPRGLAIAGLVLSLLPVLFLLVTRAAVLAALT